jgi:hypothetical protein
LALRGRTGRRSPDRTLSARCTLDVRHFRTSACITPG